MRPANTSASTALDKTGAAFMTCPWQTCGFREFELPCIPPIGTTALLVRCRKCHKRYMWVVTFTREGLFSVLGSRTVFSMDEQGIRRALNEFQREFPQLTNDAIEQSVATARYMVSTRVKVPA